MQGDTACNDFMWPTGAINYARSSRHVLHCSCITVGRTRDFGAEIGFLATCRPLLLRLAGTAPDPVASPRGRPLSGSTLRTCRPGCLRAMGLLAGRPRVRLSAAWECACRS